MIEKWNEVDFSSSLWTNSTALPTFSFSIFSFQLDVQCTNLFAKCCQRFALKSTFGLQWMIEWKMRPVSIILIKGKQNNCYIKYSNSTPFHRLWRHVSWRKRVSEWANERIKSICKQPINKMAIDFQMDQLLSSVTLISSCFFLFLLFVARIFWHSQWRLLPVAHIKLFQLRFRGYYHFSS